jgi:hypothetical protein
MYNNTISRRDSQTQHLDDILSQSKPNRTFPLHLAKPMFSFVTIGDMERYSSPVTGLEWSRGFQKVKVYRFHDNGTGLW